MLRYAFDPERGLTEIRAEPLGVDLRKDGKGATPCCAWPLACSALASIA